MSPTARGYCLALVLSWVLPGSAGAAVDPATVPLAVAVDTSRSLTAADLAAVRAAVDDQLQQLPSASRVGLVAFNDDARWLVPIESSPAEAAAALERLTPEGNYTVLNDGLFVAARGLGEGGVILLISDGRDENSATTVEDLARLCENAEVRIVAASLGRHIDERALRRLALLTDGAYVGRLRQVDPQGLGETLLDARSSVAEATVAAPAATRPDGVAGPEAAPLRPTPEAEAEAEAEREQASAGLPSWAIPVGVILAMVLAVWLMLRQRREAPGFDQPDLTLDETRPEPEPEPEPEPPAPNLETLPATPPELEGVAQAASSQSVATMAVPEESILDPKVFDKAPVPAGLEQTMVLDELPVLIVRQPSRPPRSYTLPKDQVFAIGRAPKVNTLQLGEPTVSAQHFKVVPKDGEFFVVDLDTTNGTRVNNERVKVRRLSPGDVISAGAVELEFKMSVRRLS